MKMRMLPLTLGLSGTAMAAALILPAIAQESLLPEGFGNPAETPAPKSSPAPGAAPTPTPAPTNGAAPPRSEEHTSELQSLMRISYAVFCLKKKNKPDITTTE